MNFDGIIYKQKFGTATGTKVAPTYATLMLGFLEEKLHQNLEKNLVLNIRLSYNMHEKDFWTIVLSSGLKQTMNYICFTILRTTETQI